MFEFFAIYIYDISIYFLIKLRSSKTNASKTLKQCLDAWSITIRNNHLFLLRRGSITIIRGKCFAIMRASLTKRCHAVVPIINKNKELIVADEMHESERGNGNK